MSDTGSGSVSDLFAITARELRTVVRTPAVVAPLVVFGLMVTAVATVGSGACSGYVPLVLDLVPFVETLVPLLVVALCYRAMLSGREPDELDVLRAFDVSRPAYVSGVYLGRGLALVFIVFGSSLAAGVTIPILSPPDPTFLALGEAADSPVVFPRFSVPTVLFALTVAVVALAVSAAAQTARQAIALVVGLFVTFVVGVGTATVTGLASGNLSIDAVPPVLAMSPNNTFRSLVLSIAIETDRDGSPVTALAGFVGWVVVALAVTVLTVWRPVE